MSEFLPQIASWIPISSNNILKLRRKYYVRGWGTHKSDNKTIKMELKEAEVRMAPARRVRYSKPNLFSKKVNVQTMLCSNNDKRFRIKQVASDFKWVSNNHNQYFIM